MLKDLMNILTFISNHPLTRDNKYRAIGRFLLWQFISRVSEYTVIIPFVNDTRLIAKKSMQGATGNLYVGLSEVNDMALVLHFLRKNDCFVDIGANIGAYTVLSSGVIGAKTVAIEPIITTYKYLMDNININDISEIVYPKNIGIGSKKGFMHFTASYGTTNHVVTDKEEDVEKVKVEVMTLDELLKNDKPIIIKIDVEGFESEVLKGGKKTLLSETLKIVIIELNGNGKRYGYDDDIIHQRLVTYDFEPYSYDPFKRKFTKLNLHGTRGNTVYIRDIDFVKERIRTGKQFSVLDKIL